MATCPHCGSSKIRYSREHSSTVRNSSYRRTRRGGRGHSYSDFNYKTVAICKDCGFSWNPEARGCLLCILALCLLPVIVNIFLLALGLVISEFFIIIPVAITIFTQNLDDLTKQTKKIIIGITWVVFVIVFALLLHELFALLAIIPAAIIICVLNRDDFDNRKKLITIGIIWAVFIVALAFITYSGSESTISSSSVTSTASSIESSFVSSSADAMQSEDSVSSDSSISSSSQSSVDQSDGKDESLTLDKELLNQLSKHITNIVIAYNKQSSIELSFISSFYPSDEEHSRHRVEFDSPIYRESYGKFYRVFDDSTDPYVDIVCRMNDNDSVITEIYIDNTSLENVIDLVQGFSPLLDETLSNEDLQNAIVEISLNRVAEEYEFGMLNITMTGSSEEGYSMVLKTN